MSTVLARCLECGEPVDPDRPEVVREIIGFSKPRSAGGQNHVLFRRETGRFMCSTCWVRKHATGHAGQGTLI